MWNTPDHIAEQELIEMSRLLRIALFAPFAISEQDQASESPIQCSLVDPVLGRDGVDLLGQDLYLG